MRTIKCLSLLCVVFVLTGCFLCRGGLQAQQQGTSVELAWTAVGDDDLVGQASEYDIRWNTVTITEDNWGVCVQVLNEPVPKVAGSAELFVVDGFDVGTYYFAVKVADEVPNWSGLSNVASVVVYDVVPPMHITTLNVQIME